LAVQAREKFADELDHRSGFVVFPDGLSAAAAEQKRLRLFSEIKAGKDLEELLKRHGLERPVQRMGFPRKFLDSAAGVAVFYNEGEGTEMLNGYFMLVSALNKQIDPLTQAEMEILQAFIEEEAISPAFVRRVIRDAGSEGIGSIFFPMAKMASNIFCAGSKATTTAIAIPASPCGE
jgi:hypothetical protein